jgi:hypothetical protein
MARAIMAEVSSFPDVGVDEDDAVGESDKSDAFNEKVDVYDSI